VSPRPGTPKVVFRCDASEQIGGGHAMRCLTLANALSKESATITFVTSAMPDALSRRIKSFGHHLVRIPASPELKRPTGKWEEPPLSSAAQLADAEETAAAIEHGDWVVVDHYLLDARWHSAARDFADSVLVIDDLANRSYDCDVLLDQTFGRPVGDYRDQVPSGAKVLTGSAYALLRPEFALERPAALERRQAIGPVGRILISMGTTDPGGVTARIVESVMNSAPDCALDVVLGLEAPSLEPVRKFADRHPSVSIHVDSTRMADLIRDADIAIGAAGTTSWERCCLGLPSIALVMADNQRLGAAALDAAEAAVAIDHESEIAPALDKLRKDPALVARMSAAAFAIVDGQGASRARDVMLGRDSRVRREPALRPARTDDSRNVWLWRNDFSTRSLSQASEPILWQDHQAWWQATLESADRHLLIAQMGDTPVAVLRFDRVAEGGFEVSINLAPSARNSGLGGLILAEACGTFQKDHSSVPLWAMIHRDNRASRRIFEKMGFVPAEVLSNPPFERYVLPGGVTQ
jgi:UDP-2,4-diacetamido-2,4,6-trideoxy-beta-L-altropyranose hydrolase